MNAKIRVYTYIYIYVHIFIYGDIEAWHVFKYRSKNET